MMSGRGSMMSGRMMLGVCVTVIVLAVIGDVNCHPAGLSAGVRDGRAIVVRRRDAQHDLEKMKERMRRDALEIGSGEPEPEPEPLLLSKPEIIELVVESRVTARFARTEVMSTLMNKGDKAAEATFSMRLPEDAFISAFSMTIEGVVYHSEVKEKAKAQKAYDEAKAKGQTAGQVKQSSPEESKFTVSVAIAAHSFVVFNLTYEQLLKRKDGVFEHRVDIQPGQVVPDVRVEVHLSEPQGLDTVNASWVLGDKADQSKLNRATNIDTTPNTAHVLFDSNGEGALLTGSHGIMGDFVVTYDVDHNLNAGHIEVVDGYFVHYFSPVGLPTTRKNVVFVIDKSGSMSGGKMLQTISALLTILEDVRPIDRFNFVLFDSSIQVWRPHQMVLATKENIEAAKDFVNRLYASGGTNLFDGLTTATTLLMNQDSDAMPLIIMLTDGEPTAGPVTNTDQIVSRITEIIDGRLSLFSIGFGSGVDFTFLEKLSLSNQALARKVYVDSSASIQMKGFYDEVANPLLFNLNIGYNYDIVEESSLTQSSFMAYFDGTEITVAGKLKDEYINQAGYDFEGVKLSADITAKSLDVDVKYNTSTPVQREHDIGGFEVDNFAQRLWAYLTIKSILDHRKTATSQQMKDALTERALNLSLKYHFVTPLTSLLVVKPDDDPRKTGDAQTTPAATQLPITVASVHVPSHIYPTSSRYIPHQLNALFLLATNHPPQIAYRGPVPPAPISRRVSSSSASHNSQPLYQPALQILSSVDNDPHFMIEIPETNVSVCFDVTGHPGDVIDLIHDPVLGISVSGYLISAEGKPLGDNAGDHDSSSSHWSRTYIGKVGLRLGRDHFLVLTPDVIVVNGDARYRWDAEEFQPLIVGDFVLALKDKTHLVISHGNGVVFAVMLHHVSGVNYLGFYVEMATGLSDKVDGVLGQFQRKRNVSITFPDAENHSDPQKTADDTQATLIIDNRKVPVVHKSRFVPLVHRRLGCWLVKSHNAHNLIEGNFDDYKLPHLNAHPTRKISKI